MLPQSMTVKSHQQIETLNITDLPSGAVSQRARQAIIRELRRSREVTHNIRHGGNVRELPSRAVLQSVLDSSVQHFSQRISAMPCSPIWISTTS